MELGRYSALIEEELSRFRKDLPRAGPDLPVEIARALRVIQTRLFDPTLRADDLRRGCGCGNNNFSSRFRLYVGSTMMGQVARLRVEAAKRLLSHRDLPIYLVAYHVGYRHPEVFNKVFKRVVGATPSAFRESMAGGCAKRVSRLDAG